VIISYSGEMVLV